METEKVSHTLSYTQCPPLLSFLFSPSTRLSLQLRVPLLTPMVDTTELKLDTSYYTCVLNLQVEFQRSN